ncbi:ATP-binding cassette domain-containing protein [Streptomyces sp. SID8379]|uniref:ABC transporter ATP-binding protein n=1 Tax=Streptomyces sp. HmicA12 TaxID=1156844 RepID=UPI00036A0406|nr:ATP-binding cassette domain-containing protein [Streptomyces sp. SID8379]
MSRAEPAEATVPASDIELSGVGVRYGTAKAPVTAVADVSLAVGPGEFVVLVGPSGCGKTTLLRLVAGFERPATGSVEVRRKVGVVFQQPRLFPWRTVGGNLSFALARHGVVRAERAARTQELLSLVGLPGMAGRRTWELSGGQQQRVAIARALAAEPQILLMDEPFAALDALTRERLQEEVRTLAAVTGATVLFVTHSAEEAVLLGSRVVVMAAGPGRVIDEVTVPLPREATTDVAALRGDPRFAALRAELAAATRNAAAV